MCDPVANYVATYPVNNRQRHPATNEQPIRTPEQKTRLTAIETATTPRSPNTKVTAASTHMLKT
jgi:hypothetical protein